jgi:transposase
MEAILWGDKQMSWKTFTPEELVKIKQSPYVKSATTHMIRFTSVFKEEFWEQIERGMKPADIIISMGFDPEVLGETRISGITQHIREQAESGTGFRDVRQTILPNEGLHKPLPPSKALLHMQHEIAYLKQEMEFIKKIILADREARRKCSSKPGQTSSSESSRK